MQEIRSMGKNNNSNGYLFLTLILSEIKDLGKQGSTTIYYNPLDGTDQIYYNPLDGTDQRQL